MKEEQIRPKALFDQYLALAARDASQLFGPDDFEETSCPACDSAEGRAMFTKHSFAYQDCSECRTIYANPRPTAKALENFYTHGVSTRFWATDFYRQTAESRRERLWKPKALQVAQILQQWMPGAQWLGDIGGGYGIFAEEYAKVGSSRVIVIEPSPSLAAECQSKGLNVIPRFMEQLPSGSMPDGPGAFVSFELFEHLQDPRTFLRGVHAQLPTNGVFIMTTLNGMGVDIRVLGPLSNSIFPPHHLNFFNPHSCKSLFEAEGFEVLRITTPGKLDLDIMLNSIDGVEDKFWRAFLEYSSPAERAQMQSALAESGFSSHMWVVARKIG